VSTSIVKRVIFKFLAISNRTIGMSPLPFDRAWDRLPQQVRTPTLTASTPIGRSWDYQCPGCIEIRDLKTAWQIVDG
jgi:hypothetical protein